MNKYPEDSLTYRWWARYNLYHVLHAYDSLSMANDTLRDFMEAYQYAPAVKLQELGIRLMSMHPQFNSLEEFAYLQSQVESISVSDSIDLVTKQFVQAYALYARDGFALRQTQNDIFTDIAGQCVFYSGPSVLTARSILAHHDSELILHEWGDSLCVSTASSRLASPNETPDKKITKTDKENDVEIQRDYRLHPNLLTDKLTANIMLMEDEKGYIEIYTIQGRRTGLYPVFSGNNELDLTDLNNGIYFYRVKVNSEFKHSDKIVIMR